MMARRLGQVSGWVCVALAAVLIASGPAGAESAWTQDYAAAKAQAAKANKNLLVYFSGSDWCSDCVTFEQEVLSQADLLENMAKAYVLVQIDFPKTKELDAATVAQNDKLQAKFKEAYRLEGFPTIYLASPDGTPYAKAVYQEGGAAAFTEHLGFLEKARPMEDPGSQWIEDMAIAKAKAAYFGKDLLLDFTGSDWCGYCIKLENQVFSKAVFKEKASKAFVFVKLDFPRRKKLPAHIVAQNERLSEEYSAKYGFRGYPTLYLTTSEGTPYAMAGYERLSAEVYTDGLVGMYKDHLKQRESATN